MAQTQEGHAAISPEHAGLGSTEATPHGLCGIRGPPRLHVSAKHGSPRLTFGITCVWPQPFRDCFPRWDAHLPQTGAKLLHNLHVPHTDNHSVEHSKKNCFCFIICRQSAQLPPIGTAPDLRNATDTQTAACQGRGATPPTAECCLKTLLHISVVRGTVRSQQLGLVATQKPNNKPSNLDVIDKWVSSQQHCFFRLKARDPTHSQEITRQTKEKTLAQQAPQTNLASLSTSCTEGASTPTLGTSRCSNNDRTLPACTPTKRSNVSRMLL